MYAGAAVLGAAMKWVGRILLGLVIVPVAGGAGAYFYFEAPVPDARLACYYGAYETDQHELIVVTPTSGREALRIVLMNGETWRLEPTTPIDHTPIQFSASMGWADVISEGATFQFGSCAEGTVTTNIGLLATPVVAHRIDLDATDATFESHGLKLFGRLVMPKSRDPVPVAVLVHGSEGDSAVLFNRLQYLFPANGIGVFVYDKRGTGKSEGSYTQDFNLLADDAAAALTKARALAGDRASDVGFQGGSQAGWIEPLAATKAKTDFVLVGFGLAETPADEDRDCVVVDLRDAGYSDAIIAKAREITDATARVISSHFTEGFEQFEAVKVKYGNEAWYKAIKGQYSGDLLKYPSFALRIAGPFFEVGTPFAYDSLPPLRAYDGPHLWVIGGSDSVAPSEQTLRVLRTVQVDRPKLAVVVFPNADHGIIEFERKNGERVSTRFSPGYFDLMVDWIKTKKINVPPDSAVVYVHTADNTPPSGSSVMDTP